VELPTWQSIEANWQRIVAITGLGLLTVKYWRLVKRLIVGAVDVMLYPFNAIRDLSESIRLLSDKLGGALASIDALAALIVESSHAATVASFKVDELLDERDVPTFECELPSGKCVRANLALCQLFGMEGHVMLGDGWLDAVHPDDRERVADTWIDGCKTHRPYACNYRITPGGKTLTVVARGRFIRCKRGEVIGFLGTVRPLPITQQDINTFRDNDHEPVQFL